MVEWKLYRIEKPELKEHPEYEGIYQSDLIMIYNKKHGVVIGRYMKAKNINLHFISKPLSLRYEYMRPTLWMNINIPEFL